MREKIQKFGRTLSAMVMPNIGAFIAWGLITAIFIKGGWWPNENIAKMISPMITYLLPLLIAYTAGKNVGGTRGGVAGAVAAMGVIIGTDTPMFLGAMIMGPLAGWCIKKIDSLLEGKVGAGFEMLVDNFSLGIAAMLLAVGGYLVIGHAVAWLTGLIAGGVNWMLAHKMTPLLALIVDPAKVLFLNNAVNHGIMTPLGIQQVAEMGQSMLFLVDPNPGPGLGILLACWVFGKGSTKQSAPGAVVIQLFGGIHEIYFPYVLSRPLLLLPVIIANICSLLFFTFTDFGLVAPASPGSIISIILMSPRGKTLIGILGVIIGTTVSFLLASPIVRRRPDFQGESEGIAEPQTGEAAITTCEVGTTVITKILFVCDAGMGSSALGATRFKARLMKEGLSDIKCTNCAVEEIHPDTSIVVCQKRLAERSALSGKEVIAIENFLSDPALDVLLMRCKNAATPGVSSELPSETAAPGILTAENVLVGLSSEDKQSAIRRAGELLCARGYVLPEYIDAMLEREADATTYMGDGLAIPHGTAAAKQAVLHSGIVVLQYPDGVDFDGESAHLVIGIAGVGDEHLSILAKVASAFEDPSVIESLGSTATVSDILEALA